MKKSILLSVLALVLAGCNENSSSGSNPPPTAGNVTHYVCGPEGPNDGIDNAKDIVIINSLVLATESLIPTENDGQFEVRAGASSVMAAVNLEGAFNLFAYIYQCTPDMYALNACSYNLTGSDETTKIVTSVGANQSYVTEVTKGASLASATTPVMTIVGTLGNVGNIHFQFYDEDGNEKNTVGVSRTGNGTESMIYSSSDLNWTVTESNDCSGNLSYALEDGDDSASLQVQWTYNNSATSGSGTFNGQSFNW